ncbi:CoA transferase [Verticiella sediminum]|uniref:CoA transferase n=1 Tax=Verticiella sediminum TaxID=1247510 RepID=A0A556B0Y3_9BURK|nr:CoA transferase [Verticiella sediminum]TSH98822.1 CoA transferase [Verticiella sediminum]
MPWQDTGTGALAGLRVLDLSRVLGGPYCTQILGDHGADVIKAEPPTGDETRGWGPPFEGDTAWYFRGVNRNKRGIVLDLAGDAGRELAHALLADADVLIENFKPGTLEKWGLGWDVLSERYPQLVHCRVSGFGADGPLGGMPGYDACAQAMCGLMSVNGEPTNEATRVGLPVVDMVTGLNAAIGILLALQERGRSGRGQFIDITLYDCALSLLHPHAANFFGNGKIPRRTGNAHPNIAPYETVQAADAPVFLAVGNDRQFRTLAQVLEAPALADDPRYASNADRLAHRDALHASLAELLGRHQAGDIAQRLLRAGVPAAPVFTVDAALAQPHTVHRGMVLEGENYRAVASPIKLSRTPASLRRLPPALDADGAAVRGTLAERAN